MQAERTAPVVHGPYELRLALLDGSLMITRQDEGRWSTVAFLDSEADWHRFVAALESGADEVAAVHAIDGTESANPTTEEAATAAPDKEQS